MHVIVFQFFMNATIHSPQAGIILKNQKKNYLRRRISIVNKLTFNPE